MSRTEVCMCGGAITVGNPEFPGDVAFSMRRHNASALHAAWRRRGGFARAPIYVVEHGYRLRVA